jgi:hypothetical protein
MNLQRLASYGVSFHGCTEPHVATDNELVRNILLALLSSLAKVEAYGYLSNIGIDTVRVGLNYLFNF